MKKTGVSAVFSSWLIFRERDLFVVERDGYEKFKLVQESVMGEAHAYFTELDLVKGMWGELKEPKKLFDAFPWLNGVAIVDQYRCLWDRET